MIRKASAVKSENSTGLRSLSERFVNMRISTKLPMTIVCFAVAAGISVSIGSLIISSAAVKMEASLRLETALAGRARGLQDYFRLVREELGIVAENPNTKQALKEFTAAWNRLEAPRTPKLHSLYIDRNPYPQGEKYRLNDAGDGSLYSAVHARFHPWFHKLHEDHEFYDIFLLDTEGNLVYSVVKELDYATNMRRGQWAETDLAKAFRKAAENPRPDYLAFFDFRPYPPSLDAPASFISTPVIGAAGELLGVLAFQMPIGRINAIMGNLEGMGETGESYIVGTDYLMRSDSRFSEESTILIRRIVSKAAREALAGRSGVEEMIDYRGVPVMSAYRSFEFLGTRWALIAEIDLEELSQPIFTMQYTLMIVGLGVITFIGLLGFLVARGIAQPIETITHVMRELASGNYEVEIPHRQRGDEIGQMASATQVFKNYMVQKLQREELLRLSIVETAADGIVTISQQGTVISFNKMAETIFGYSADEVIGQNIQMLMPQRYAAGHDNRLSNYLKTGEAKVIGMPREVEGVRSDGSVFPMDLAVGEAKDKDDVIFVGIVRDITARKQADEQVRKLSNAVEQSPSLFTITDTEGIIEYVNPAFTVATGYESEEAIGKKMSFLQSGETPLEAYESLWQTITSGKVWRGILRNKRKSGELYWDQLTISPVHDTHGVVTNFIGIGQDVTDQKRAEERLRKLSSAVEQSVSLIVITNPEAVIEYVNPAFTLLTGYEAKEVIGKNPNVWQSGETSLEIYEDLWRTIKSGKIWKGVLKDKKKNGEFFWSNLTVSPILDANRVVTHFVGTGMDVTVQRETERQLIQARKMDTVGQLTGGIAHDFNNILGIVMGNLELLERQVADDSGMSDRVQKAIRGTERGASLTKKLLGFSRQDAVERRLTEVNVFIDSLHELIAKSVTPSIRVEQHLADDLWSVEIDPGEFEDALLNLALNARDAMPAGGALVIETANKFLDEAYLKRSPQAKAGEFVMISLSDTGTGMTDEVIEKAFEPFFTTKEQGKGTGLGLSMVYGFVKRSGGHVKIYSEAREGTTIRLYLPRAREGASADEGTTDTEDRLPGGNETILVIDDEADLVDVAVAHLEGLGYRTFSANDGKQALKILEDHEDIDLMFSDIIMPGGLDGYKLAQAALKIRPALKILLTSGFARRREELTNGENAAATALAGRLLHKPYNRSELAMAVRRTLDEENGDKT